MLAFGSGRAGWGAGAGCSLRRVSRISCCLARNSWKSVFGMNLSSASSSDSGSISSVLSYISRASPVPQTSPNARTASVFGCLSIRILLRESHPAGMSSLSCSTTTGTARRYGRFALYTGIRSLSETRSVRLLLPSGRGIYTEDAPYLSPTMRRNCCAKSTASSLSTEFESTTISDPTTTNMRSTPSGVSYCPSSSGSSTSISSAESPPTGERYVWSLVRSALITELRSRSLKADLISSIQALI
ncbi:hypothetical protein TRVA0_013S00254 [Trichomonascus vanleenenianus]|uniref:uncharacterized protein n=1 Tax=Trichomonascus vanleenenianus TaxID=2268995 RepID=UPI003EC97297